MDVLVVEDDAETREYLKSELNGVGFRVSVAGSLLQAQETMATNSFDVIVLDRLLPDGDGINFIERIRLQGVTIPVLVLSALGEVRHRVDGLRAGGDDYLIKPFDVIELAARLEVLVRRVASAPATSIQVGDLFIDILGQRVVRAGKEIRLQPREFKLLEYLAQQRDQVVTRTMLLEAVWGLTFDPQTNVVDVHISRLRNKLDSGFDSPLLHTVRGQGYRLAETA